MRAAVYASRSEERTTRLGWHVGSLCTAGDVFLLYGELGAGKTRFIRGLASGLGVVEYAFSPSFVLVREYRGRLTLYHMDFYRLEQPEEIADLGVEEYLYGDGVCAIEWAERAAGLLPKRHLAATLSYVANEPESRTIRFTASGQRYESLLEQVVGAMGESASWS